MCPVSPEPSLSRLQWTTRHETSPIEQRRSPHAFLRPVRPQAAKACAIHTSIRIDLHQKQELKVDQRDARCGIEFLRQVGQALCVNTRRIRGQETECRL